MDTGAQLEHCSIALLRWVGIREPLEHCGVVLSQWMDVGAPLFCLHFGVFVANRNVIVWCREKGLTVSDFGSDIIICKRSLVERCSKPRGGGVFQHPAHLRRVLHLDGLEGHGQQHSRTADRLYLRLANRRTLQLAISQRWTKQVVGPVRNRFCHCGVFVHALSTFCNC